MYYEIYIDVLFLSNLLLDDLLLLFIWRMLLLPANHVRILLGAVIGSLLTCIVVLIPCTFPIVKYALFHLVINSIMIKIAYRICDWRMFWEVFGMLYISALLMGGILHFLEPYVNQNLLLLTAVMGYYLMRGIGFFVRRLQRNRKSKCRVVLYTSTGMYELQALLDTGNELRDAISRKGVNIIGNALAKKMFSEEEMSTVRYVPYHSIGKSGVLPAVKIAKMDVWVQNSTGPAKQEIAEPIIGISDRDISTKDAYQIILNPDILGGM